MIITKEIINKLDIPIEIKGEFLVNIPLPIEYNELIYMKFPEEIDIALIKRYKKFMYSDIAEIEHYIDTKDYISIGILSKEKLTMNNDLNFKTLIEYNVPIIIRYNDKYTHEMYTWFIIRYNENGERIIKRYYSDNNDGMIISTGNLYSMNRDLNKIEENAIKTYELIGII